MTRKPNHNHVFIRELFPIASSIYSGKQLQTVDDDTWERHYRAIMAEEERPRTTNRRPTMSIKIKCVDHTLHIQVAACDRFSCEISLPTPYADDLDPDADQIMAWARKMALQVNQSNSAWGVYHTYSGEDVAWLILNAVAKTEFTDDKAAADAWELKFRTIIVNHHQQEN